MNQYEDLFPCLGLRHHSFLWLKVPCTRVCVFPASPSPTHQIVKYNGYLWLRPTCARVCVFLDGPSLLIRLSSAMVSFGWGLYASESVHVHPPPISLSGTMVSCPRSLWFSWYHAPECPSHKLNFKYPSVFNNFSKDWQVNLMINQLNTRWFFFCIDLSPTAYTVQCGNW